MKRSLSLILSLVMVMGIITSVPLTVSAASVDDLTFELNEDGTGYVVDSCDEGASGQLIIPDTYKGLAITSIGDYAFYSCESLTSITIPESVTSIGEYTFYFCTNLTSITIPDSVTSIGDYVFYNCCNLTSVTVDSANEYYCSVDGVLFNKDKTQILCYPARKTNASFTIPNGVTSIGSNTFSNCTNLVSITIPDSVTSIGQSAFNGCTSLTSITIPDSVTNIGYAAFRSCTSLVSIEIPDSVSSSIDVSTFHDCTSLTSVSIGSGVTGIGWCAFYACINLTSITIPDSVTSISDSAFNGCTSLASVSIGSGVTSIGYHAFYNCKSLTSIKIPGSVEYIDSRAFGFEDSTSESFTIYGIKGTAAETYAKENGFTFVEIKKPAQPTLKKVYNENSYVRVIWRAVKGADLYRVYRMVSGGEYEYIGSTTSTSYTDKKAPAGKTCRYIVKAKNEAGYSDASASLAVKHIDEPTLKSIENSAYGVLIKWNKVTGAEKYNVYRKVSGGEYEYIGATSNIYYTDKTAKSGTKYYYAIRAKRDDSISSQSVSLSKYYLADPTLKTPTSTTSGIKLSWSKVTGAEGYIIYRKTGSGSYTKIKTEKGVSNLSYTDSSAKKGKKYTYKIKAYKSKTYSAYSNTKTITDKY